MSNTLKAVLFGALAVVFSASALADSHEHDSMSATEDAAAQPVISASGVVKDIDFTSKKISIAHEAISSIGWPAMTMRFTFIDADPSITKLKVGSHVNFSFVQQGNISLLKNITVTQS